MTVSSKRLFSITVFYLSFIAIYLLNNNRDDPQNLLVLNSLLSLITLIFIIMTTVLLFSKTEGMKTGIDFVLFLWVFIATIIVIVFMFRGVIVVHGIYLLVFYLIMNLSICELSRKKMAFVIYVGIISLAIQFSNFELDGRHVLSYIDPNYSSMIVFLFGAFCYYKYSKVLSCVVFIMGVITLSRNYILVVLCFFAMNILVSKTVSFKKIGLFFLKPLISIIIIIAIPTIASYYVADNYHLGEVTVNTIDSKMSGDIIDSSNVHRALATVSFLKDLMSNIWLYSIGVDSENYIKTIFINTPHHSIFQLILNYGWFFSIPYMILFFKEIYKICKRDYNLLPFILSFYLYLMILGGGIYGIYIVWIAFIFKLNGHENK